VASDGGRSGLKARCRRRWCPRGARPPWLVEDRYERTWLYAAVEPTAGGLSCLLPPGVDGACLEAFLARLRREAAGRVAVVLGGAGGHRSKRVRWPEGIAPLPLPAHSPELNPAERVFGRVRARLANRPVAALAELEGAIAEALGELREGPSRVTRLTADPWWRDALATTTTPSA
jgi:hypothetical protein